MSIPVIASLGMGLHSSVMVDRWLTEPASRDFDLTDLTVISSQVGLEDDETRRQMEELLFPRQRAARVRTVQIARRGSRQADGIVVLDDTREPIRCYTAGSGYTLRDELLRAGTIPQYANGQRRCSLKWKGWPIDTWIAGELGGRPYRHAMGFHADEQDRIADDIKHSKGLRQPFYPLAGWRMGHGACAAWSLASVGEVITKSACSICCFAKVNGGDAVVLARYRRAPQDAALAIFLEHVALALNPRSTLFPGRTVRSVVENDGNAAALELYQAQLAAHPWGVYRVQRILPALPARPARRVVCLSTLPTREAAYEHLATFAARNGWPLMDDPSDVTPRLVIYERTDRRPTLEEQIVICPVSCKTRPNPASRLAGSTW